MHAGSTKVNSIQNSRILQILAIFYAKTPFKILPLVILQLWKMSSVDRMPKDIFPSLLDEKVHNESIISTFLWQ